MSTEITFLNILPALAYKVRKVTESLLPYRIFVLSGLALLFMTMSNIKPSTIDKHLIVFEEIKTICDNRCDLHPQKIAYNHKISTAAFYASVKLNYFKKVDLERYECLVGKFERIHVRKILEYANNRYKNLLATDKDTDRDIEMNNKNIQRDNLKLELKHPSLIKEGSFIPPTFEMVEKYCNERINDVNPAKFMAHYEAVGWLVGKAKMKDWKASVRYWEHNNTSSYVVKQEITREIVIKYLNLLTIQELTDEFKRRGYTGTILPPSNEIKF